MARLETWYKQDLKKPLIVHKHADVFNQDSRGNLIGVEVYKDGEPVTLAGSISGYCLLADGTTVPAVGASRSGNKASVLIPQTAYSVPGPITITIKNVEGNDIATLCAVVGLVRQSVSGNLVNPGSVVTDWSNSINAQLQAVQTAADNVGAIVAAPFNENTVYVVGNYVTNNGNLYRITGDHAAGVAWTDTTKVQCTVGSELSDLKSAINEISEPYGENIFDPYHFTVGKALNSSTGAEVNASSFNLTDYIDIGDATQITFKLFSYTGTVSFYVAYFSTNDVSGFIRRIGNSNYIPGRTMNLDAGTKYIRIVFENEKNSNGTVDPFGVVVVKGEQTIAEYIPYLTAYDKKAREVAESASDTANYVTAHKTGRFYSIGNSILTGSVWINGVQDHLSSFANAPYAQIASALRYPENRVDHTLLSDTGLIYDAGRGTFLETIKTVDLSGYDYVLTMLWTNDLNNYFIGSLDSADLDGSIAGAVVDLVNYIKSSNSSCRLILVSVPPVGYNAARTGSTVFTGLYSTNVSIADLDDLMHRLAQRYDFTYVDWQGMALSYDYQSYTDGDNVHANNEDTYRRMGAYLADQVSAYQHVTDIAADRNEKAERVIDKELPTETAVVSGNFAVIDDAANGYLQAVDVSDLSTGDVIRSSGKNLFTFMNTWDTLTKNNTTFTIDREKGSIKIVSTGDNTNFASQAGDETDCINPDGTHCLFYFVFQADTVVTISDNRSIPVEYQDHCFLQVSWKNGYTVLRDYGNGLTFTAKANVVYSVNIIILGTTKQEGQFETTGFYMYPQLEIGSCKTSFEPFSGEIVTYKNVDDTNLFAINPTSKASSFKDGNVVVKFRPDIKAVILPETTYALDANLALYDRSADPIINGINWGNIGKFSFEEDTPIYAFGDLPENYSGRIMLQISDGANVMYDYGRGLQFIAKAGTEYGYRYYVRKGVIPSDVVLRPTIYRGINALRSHYPTTVLLAEHGTVTATYTKQTISEKVYSGNDILGAFKKIAPAKPFNRFKPTITFIDDDVSSVALVQRYHDMMVSHGIVGNYAVITDHLLTKDGLTEKLLEYETEGFGMLFHCHSQKSNSGDTTWYFMNDSRRDMSKVRENIFTGLREMAEFGFSNYKYWVTPYGANDMELQNFAKECGFECLITNDTQSIIENRGNVSRWNIPRLSFSVDENVDTRIMRLKALMDTACETNAWVIVTTHVNTWDDTTTGETKFAEIVNYAKSKGMSIESFPQAFAERKAMFYLTEMFGNMV